MRFVLLVACGVAVVAAALGWGVRRWVPEPASWIGVGVAITARLLGALAIAWSVARVVHRHLDVFRLALVVVVSLIGIWMAVVAIGMLYLALFRRDVIEDESNTA